MDAALVSWARRVKRAGAPPPLWLFSDPARMPDLCAVVARLPPGLCGVVFRHDTAPERALLGAGLARLCRVRRLALVVAGDPRLAAALGAGVHLRGGRRVGVLALPRRRFVTASVHNRAELARARREGADAMFCSPVFATDSHPEARGLGVFGFLALARAMRPAKPIALGGISGETVLRLGKHCAGAGAIAAFLCRDSA